MKTWYVDGYKLKPLEIEADSFDEVIAKARKINKGYSEACVIKIDGIPVENFYKRKENK